MDQRLEQIVRAVDALAAAVRPVEAWLDQTRRALQAAEHARGHGRGPTSTGARVRPALGAAAFHVEVATLLADAGLGPIVSHASLGGRTTVEDLDATAAAFVARWSDRLTRAEADITRLRQAGTESRPTPAA